MTRIAELLTKTFTMLDSDISLEELNKQIEDLDADEFIDSIDALELADFILEYYDEAQSIVRSDLLNAPAFMKKYFIDDPGENEIQPEEIRKVAHRMIRWLCAHDPDISQ